MSSGFGTNKTVEARFGTNKTVKSRFGTNKTVKARFGEKIRQSRPEGAGGVLRPAWTALCSPAWCGVWIQELASKFRLFHYV